MAMAERQRLMERLPPVRGRLRSCVPLAQVTWFRVGGPAEVMFRPDDVNDLVDFTANKPSDVAVTAMGVGSNLLVRDGGILGVVLRLGRGLAGIKVEGNTVTAGAGIVYDSVPENEYHETLHKSRGMCRALELAARGLNIDTNPDDS